MVQRRTTSGLAAAAMVFSLLLAGCSDDAAEPQPLPSASASTPVTTDSPYAADVPATLPVMPAAAMGTSAASAKEFVRYWIAVLNYSGPAGESTRLRELSSPQCLDCDAIADAIDKVSRNGGRISGRGWTVLNAVELEPKRPAWSRIRTTVMVNKQTVFVERGGKPHHFRGGPGIKVFDLSRRGNEWCISYLGQRSR